jgi:hypothetical protein
MKCGFASTACTIVRIAARLAMSPSLIAVAANLRIIELKVDADPRLAAGAGGVAHYLADAAGMADEVASQLQSATVAACLRAFASLTPAYPLLRIHYEQFVDRIEIVLVQKGNSAPAVGLDSLAGFVTPSPQNTGAGAFAGFDRVQYDARSGETITRLVKYIGKSGN